VALPSLPILPDIASIFPPLSIPDLELTTTTGTIAALFGAQYSPNRRFSVFGEVGLAYASTEAETGFSETEAHTFGARAGVGVTLYFN
jgi:hypothetical protein